MCNPAMILMAASTAVSATGSLMQGNAQRKMAEANSQALAQQAVLREEKTKFDAAQAAQKGRKMLGAQLVAANNEGLDVSSFSDVMADSALENALEISAIRFRGRQEAANLRFQSAAKFDEGKAAWSAGLMGAAGAVLSGGAKMAGSMPNSSGSVSIGNPWQTTTTRADGVTL